MRVFEPPWGPRWPGKSNMTAHGQFSWIQNYIDQFCYPLDILNDFYVYLSTFRLLDGPVDLHFGPKMTENWYFL